LRQSVGTQAIRRRFQTKRERRFVSTVCGRAFASNAVVLKDGDAHAGVAPASQRQCARGLLLPWPRVSTTVAFADLPGSTTTCLTSRGLRLLSPEAAALSSVSVCPIREWPRNVDYELTSTGSVNKQPQRRQCFRKGCRYCPTTGSRTDSGGAVIQELAHFLTHRGRLVHTHAALRRREARPV
jgi:hypothetical protein